MSLQTETLVLGEERDRLDDRLDELADQVADADEPAALQQLASEAETKLSGVDYLCAEYGADAEVTVRGLDAGEYAQVEDRLARMRAEADQAQLPGAERNVMAAFGLVDAPFLHDVDTDDVDAVLEAIASQPVGVATWLQARANALTTVEGNGYRSFSERVAAHSED